MKKTKSKKVNVRKQLKVKLENTLTFGDLTRNNHYMLVF